MVFMLYGNSFFSISDSHFFTDFSFYYCFMLTFASFFFYVYFYTDSSFLLPTSALGNHIASWVDFGPVFGVAFR